MSKPPKRTGPIALMLVPCENIFVDPFQKNVHALVNVIDVLETKTLPFNIPKMYFYIRFCLYDGGEFRYHIEIWDQSNKLLDSPEQKASLTEVTAQHNAIELFKNFALPGEGQHWVKVFVNGEESIRVPFFVVRAKKEKDAASESDAKLEKHRKERPLRSKSIGAEEQEFLIH